MANRIKGITVEIGGDTTKLSKTLEGVNKNIKKTQTQLKDVHNTSRAANQTNHSPKSLSRLVIYRMTRNALDE